MMRVPTPSYPLVTPWGIALSESQNSEALAENLEAQFQPVTHLSGSAVIETINEALKCYILSPTSELQIKILLTRFTKPSESQFQQASGPKSIPNRKLKHLLKQAVSVRYHIFNAVLRAITFPKRGSTLG